MEQGLINTFAGLVMVAASTAAADDDLTAVQTQLNLQKDNVFYNPGAAVRVEESCKTKDDKTICQMEVTYGANLRVQTVEATYKTDGQGDLIDIQVSANLAQFYSASSGNYDEKMARTSRLYNDAMDQEARDKGYNSTEGYVIAKVRAGDYNVDAAKTAVAKAITNAGGEFGSFQTLDRIIRLQDTGINALSETSCALISAVGEEKTNYDINIEKSFRAFCVTYNYDFEKTFDRTSKYYNWSGIVTTTFSIYALTGDGPPQQENFKDIREAGAQPNGENNNKDHDRYEALSQELRNKASTNAFSSAP